MRRRLPSLKAIRAFEAVGRHSSCSQAAEELSVSQSAVSHQIRLLEQELGLKLFDRKNRRLILTPSGRDLQAVATVCFDRLEEVAREIRVKEDRHSVNVSLSYPIGVAWLSRHIGAFGRSHPEVHVNLNFSWSLVDLEQDGYEFAIRWGRGPWPGLDATPMLPGQMVPLCAPSYLPSDDPLEDQGDVLRESLLHLEGYRDWARWLETAGLEPAWAQHGALLGDAMNLIRAATQGDGVILMWLPLAVNELESGSLIIPSRIAIDLDCSYWLVRASQRELGPLAQTLSDYLQDAAAKDCAVLESC